jgi:hypothetical protein
MRVINKEEWINRYAKRFAEIMSSTRYALLYAKKAYDDVENMKNRTYIQQQPEAKAEIDCDALLDDWCEEEGSENVYNRPMFQL